MKKYIVLTLCCFFLMSGLVSAMEKGDRGDNVLQAQKLLVFYGYLDGEADGVFGSKTERAVKKFQDRQGLEISGRLDETSLAILKEKLKEKSSDKMMKESTQKTGHAVGDRGKHIYELQQRLVSAGFSPGDLDGIFGNDTIKAVKRFQAFHKIGVTGVVDDKTFALLQEERGLPESYKKKFTMEATAYTAYDPGNGSYTARGNLLRHGLVSVDPSLIPLGSELYIEGYGYAVADDTGGSIRGHRIDLAMDSRDDALQFGRRDVVVYVL